MAEAKSALKNIGPILLILIPIIIAVSIFMNNWMSTHPGEYTPEGEVIYSMQNPGEYGLTGDEKPGLDSSNNGQMSADPLVDAENE